MSSPPISYAPHLDATSEGEVAALASVYAYILRCAEPRRTEEKKRGTRPGAPDDGEESKNASIAELEYTR